MKGRGGSGASEVLARRFRVQAASCSQLGSLLYSGLMEQAACNVESGGILLGLLEGWESRPGPDAMALRLFGAVHRLVLSGSTPELARYYPSAGGFDDAGRSAERAWPAFLDAVEANAEYCRAAMEQPPQTNEVGRSASLMVGYARVASATGLPLSILEVGASGGLNLHWDSFYYGKGAECALGDPASPVSFPAEWFPEGLGGFLGGSITELPVVATRAGCDLSPIDVTTDEGAAVLSSFIWPDQRERFTRLQGAIQVARLSPVPIEVSTASAWLARELGVKAETVATVVSHSVFLQYISESERKEMEEILGSAGERATADSPLAWLRLEPAPERKVSPELAELRLTLWPGGVDEVVALAGFHGPPVLPPR